MFTIGLFSTHIPYILLAMVYGAYLGFSSIVRPAGTDHDDPEPVKQIIKKAGAEDILQKGRAYHMFDFFTAAITDHHAPVDSFTGGSHRAGHFTLWRSAFFSIPLSRPPPVQ